MSTPMSQIRICAGVTLDPTYQHTIYFATEAEQYAYFRGKTIKQFTGYSYLRKTWSIQVEGVMQEARSWSYLYLTNDNKKWYYYFITSVEYVNDRTVELSLELDVMQTYMFCYTLLPSFIERAHPAREDYVVPRLDEGLELGEYVDNEVQDIDLSDLALMVMSTIDLNVVHAFYSPDGMWVEPDVEVPPSSAMSYNGVFSGMSVYAVYFEDWVKVAETFVVLDYIGRTDAIVNMWLYPKDLLDEGSYTVRPFRKFVGVRPKTVSKTFSWKTGTLDGYTPKNDRLRGFPYQVLYVSNNSGQSANYHFERFQVDEGEGQFDFTLDGAMSPDGGVKLSPAYYNHQEKSYEEGISLSGFPSCAWDADIYKMWLAQNSNQHDNAMAGAGLAILAGGATAIGSAVMGNAIGVAGGVGAVIGGLQQINGLIAQKKDMSTQPPQARGNYSSSVNVSAGKQTFTLIRKSVDSVHARMIDDYLTMYGYKAHYVAVPERKARENWTYVKTVGCNISGEICTEDLLKIKSIYDNGITFWVNGDRIGDYQLSNAPLQ